MSSSSGTSRKETERTKLIQEKCQTLLTQMLRDEDNKYCVDCDAKGPRWASWNLGVFLCIRCAGIHRNLGVHISRVKSVNLDTWTPEQVISLQQMGNSRARAVYEAQLPDGFRRPQTDTALESFIRAKYEHKKYLAREWVPPSPPKVDWAKEIDEELEKQKRKKKAAQACTALGLSQSIMSGGGDKKSSANATSVKSVPLPAPLPKPKPGQSGSSPKTQRISLSSSSGGGAISGDHANTTNDLLGLSSPTKPIQNSLGGNAGAAATQDLHNDSFSGFLSATPNSCNDHRDTNATINSQNCNSNSNNQQQQQNTLAKEEEDFFNQGSLGGINEKDKSGKLTKDSILALYGTAPNANVVAHNPHNPQHMNFGQQQQQQQQQMFPAASGGAFSGGMVAPGYMGGAVAGVIPQQHHHQFMTPPNSASMYNSPVMTAPTAFSAPGMHMIGGGVGVVGGGVSMGGQQFGQQPMGAGMLNIMPGGMSGGIMATGQPTQTQTSQSADLNFMHTNQPLLSGMRMMTAAGQPTQTQTSQSADLNYMYINQPLLSGMRMMTAAAPSQQQLLQQQQQMFGGLTMGSMNMQPMTATFQTPAAATAAGASTANLNQQFGNLNIGNVWQ